MARLLLGPIHINSSMEPIMDAQINTVTLPMRSHTILGACEAIGEDFGFNPVLLRVPFSAIVLYSPLVAVGAYLVLAAVVLGSRLLFPAPRQVAEVEIAARNEDSVTCSEVPQLAKAA